jgi:hypothetical protein
MKLLMESWRRYVAEISDDEHASKEKYFGPDPEELRCIKSYRHGAINGSMFESCMNDNGFRFIKAGSYRMVWSIPGIDEMVLKIAFGGHRAYAQNKMEADAAAGTKYNYVMPKVYDAADDYLWIKQQFVHVDDVSRKYKEMFPTLDLHTGYGFAGYLSKMMRYIEFGGNDAAIDAYNDSLNSWDKKYHMITKAEIDNMLKNKSLVVAANLYSEFGLSTGDVREGNFGYVIDPGGKARFVIHDLDVFGGKQARS